MAKDGFLFCIIMAAEMTLPPATLISIVFLSMSHCVKKIDIPPVMYYKLKYRRCVMITLRLDPKLEQNIKITSKNLGISTSELIRISIINYLDKLNPPNAWDIGRDLFGKHASGQSDLSIRRKELLKNKIRAKRK